MKLHNIPLTHKITPPADPAFLPLGGYFTNFLKTAREPFALCVERDGGFITVYDTFIHGTPDMSAADCYFAERLLKFLLWARGGYRVIVCGNAAVADFLRKTYAPGGVRAFDAAFMERVYENKFEIITRAYADKPAAREQSKPVGRHLGGCRIGFDAGGSDRKVSAVIDGEPVYSEEVVWFPKTNADPDYHYEGIVSAMKTAAAKMPRVDAIGVSSAGIYIANRTMVASLFLKVPEDKFEEKVKDIYIRAAAEIGADIPVEVANDGDVTALAGAMSLEDDRVLGIAMGTSQAGGYVDAGGNITGWLNELAFTPVDANADAMSDEWSGDVGCGVKYFSQDGVIKLAEMQGITLDPAASPGDKLKAVQALMDAGDPRAAAVFASVGVYLGHSVPLYCMFYDIKHILLLGRVMSGEGGNLVYENAVKVLREEYPEIAAAVELHLPDEKIRRVGQSVAAASLAEVK